MALQNILKTTNQVIVGATQKIINLENKNLLSLDTQSENGSLADVAFSYYYGKFQNAASKVSLILNHIEEKMEMNPM